MNKGLLAVLALVVVGSAHADDSGYFRVKAGLGNADYTQSFSDQIDTLEGSFATQSVSVSYTSPSHTFFDLSMRQNASGADAAYATDQSQKYPLTRNDLALTVGSADLISGSLSTVGLFTGKTEVGSDHYAHETLGIAFGLAKIFSGELGSLGLGAGLALLATTFTDASGDSVDSDLSYGYSANVSYSYFFTKNIGVSADVKYQRYDATYPESQYWTAFDDTETITSTNLSLIAQF